MRYLRESYSLSRSDLAEAINRSTGFIQKAEALTFPRYPAALADFYCQNDPPPNLLIPNWEQQDRQLLQDAYREAQRRQREAFLESWRLVLPAHLSAFRAMWGPVGSRGSVNVPFPTQYALSQGLCIPAYHVHKYDQRLDISSAMLEALSDLADYVTSGRYYADFGYDDESAAQSREVLRTYQHYKGSSTSKKRKVA